MACKNKGKAIIQIDLNKKHQLNIHWCFLLAFFQVIISP